MLRRSGAHLALGWHESAFTKAALQCITLFNAHREMLEDTGRETREAMEIRDQFGRAVEQVRPLYSVDAGLAANKF